MYVPDVSWAPAHPPEALQEVEFVEDQLIVPVPPYNICAWLTVMVTVGCGVTGGLVDADTNELFSHRITIKNSIKVSICCVLIDLILRDFLKENPIHYL